jgi:hypothetical protein
MDTEPILQFFAHEHLAPDLAAVSKPFSDLATKLMDLPRNAERSTALRKLLEAKDAAVRAKIAAPPAPRTESNPTPERLL